MAPDGEVFGIGVLEFDEFLADGLGDGFVFAFEGVNCAVEAEEFFGGVGGEAFFIEEVFPAVDDFTELGAPVANVVICDDGVSEEACDPGEAVAEDGAADVTDVHGFGYVGGAEIEDDA